MRDRAERMPLTVALAAALMFAAGTCRGDGGNLLDDPSFEVTREPDRFGHVFPRWGGWKYEGDCEFRVGDVARTGAHSCLLRGGAGAKIRIAQDVELAPGRYRVTAYIRGLDIGTGADNAATEFMFDGKYQQLNKKGTFGWTRLAYVADIVAGKKAGPSFGMFAPGYLWIDDVALEKVGDDVPTTPAPSLSAEEAPVAPPGEITAGAVRCRECGYRNNPGPGRCYACGAGLPAGGDPIQAAGPSARMIASFEDRNPFDNGRIVAEHATEGRKALRLDRSHASMDGPQDWRGFDWLKADLYVDAKKPLSLYVEVRDASTRDYWTRVNYTTVVPPGASTLLIPVRQLYVGEKSRPGRMLDLARVTRLVFNAGDSPPGPLTIDNVRLERDDSPRRVTFDGLLAFDLGTATSPVMEGFTPITPATPYSKGRGYGLKDARIWRAYDALQPDPLYRDFLCIESGGLAVDLPNGRYRVLVNIDSPSGFWGEYQTYRERTVLAEGRPVVRETMDFPAFRRKYFRHWDGEDLPAESTFDKYQKTSYHEKRFDVDVSDGQLDLEFRGANWACSVSAVVIFPASRAAEGEAFLRFVEARRRLHFDNAFRRILPAPEGDPLNPRAEDARRGFVVFQPDLMRDVAFNATPRGPERADAIRGEAFAGEVEPVTPAIVALRDLGAVSLTVSDLRGEGSVIPASRIDVGYVSNRLTRVTAEGSVYTISPRLILPGGTATAPAGFARRFWLTIHTPADARPGDYRGRITIRTRGGGEAQVPLLFRVRAGVLDPLDIPAGPFGHSIPIPEFDDPAAAALNDRLLEGSLRTLREAGFTSCSGLPDIRYKGFEGGRSVLDFTAADRQMKRLKDLGFLAVASYGAGVGGLNAYSRDDSAMAAAGFTDQSAFIRAVYSAVREHASRSGWIPVYYNLADEPIGDDLPRAAENAEAYRRAFPVGPPYFTGATSFRGRNRDDPHFRLSKALHVASWNEHDEPAVGLLREAGADWAFYNGGDRWTFGVYMYKAAHEFGMKFRNAWHWNASAGDPYYALDCREDDYAWCQAAPDGRLVPSVEFERLREGLGDYRRLLTLDRLARRRPDATEARAARTLIDGRMKAFHLGGRDHDALFPPSDWSAFRRELDEAIERLRR